MNFYKRYMGDYARDTAHLSLAEHGAYTLLLDHYYATERPLPADDAALFRLCRGFDGAEQQAIRRVADMFFPIGDDGLRHNDRADRDIPKDTRARKSAQNNGLRGGRPIVSTAGATPKKGPSKPEAEPIAEPKQNPSGYDNVTQSKPAANTHQTPDTRQEQEQRTIEQRAARQASRFDDFWAVYPNRKGKAEALKKWKARGLDSIADMIIHDVKARIAGDREWLDGYVPHGSTYVNGSRWEDDIVPPRDNSGGADGRDDFMARAV